MGKGPGSERNPAPFFTELGNYEVGALPEYMVNESPPVDAPVAVPGGVVPGVTAIELSGAISAGLVLVPPGLMPSVLASADRPVATPAVGVAVVWSNALMGWQAALT